MIVSAIRPFLPRLACLGLAFALSGCVISNKSVIPVEDRDSIVRGAYRICKTNLDNASPLKDCETYQVTALPQGRFEAKGPKTTYRFAVAFMKNAKGVRMGVIEMDDTGPNKYKYGQIMHVPAKKRYFVQMPHCNSFSTATLYTLRARGGIALDPDEKGGVFCRAVTLQGAYDLVSARQKEPNPRWSVAMPMQPPEEQMPGLQ